jgi:hypothetical protein
MADVVELKEPQLVKFKFENIRNRESTERVKRVY